MASPATVEVRHPSFAQIPVNVLMDYNDQHKSLTEDFLVFLRMYGESEEYVATHQLRLLKSDALSAAADRGETCLEKAALALRSFVGNVMRSHAQYSRLCTEEVKKPLETVFALEWGRHSRIKAEWNKIVKTYINSREKLAKSKKAVSKAVEEHRAACHLSNVAAEKKGPHFTDMDRARLRVVRAQEARRQAETVGRDCVKELHHCISERDGFVKDACRAYQQLETERLTKVKESLLRFAELEREHLQSRLRDIEALEKTVQGLEVGREVASLIDGRRDPDATHLYNRALVVLEWGWMRQQRMRRKSSGGQGGEAAGEGGGEGAEEGFSREKSQIDAILAPLLAPSPPPCEPGAGEGAGTADGEGPTATDGSLPALPEVVDADNGREEDGAAAAAAAAALNTNTNGGGSGSGDERRSLLTSPPLLPCSPSSGAGLGDVPFSELIDHERGRAYFIRVLNEGRGRYTDVGAKYDELAACLTQLLDKCMDKHDVRAAQQTMQMGNTFFRTSSSSAASTPTAAHRSEAPDALTRQEKQYLLTRIRAHPIWRSPKFWEDALMLGVADQFDLCPQAATWDSLHGDALREAVMRVHNTVFGQLGSLAFNMAECGVPRAEIHDFVMTMCERTQLGEDQVLQLEAIVQGIKEEEGAEEVGPQGVGNGVHEEGEGAGNRPEQGGKDA